MTLDNIQTLIDNGKLFYLQQLGKQLSLMQKGCGSVKSLSPIQRLIRGLTFQYNADVIDDTTDALYKCLSKALGGFASTYTPDPNVVVPGNTYIINNPVAYLPGMDIPYELFSSTEGVATDGSGGRSVYRNTILKGINPLMQDQTTTLLYINVDYDLIPSGGFILKAGGNLPYIYPGQSLRANSYDFLGSIPDVETVRIPQIFTDASTTPLSSTYLNATYPYPQYIEGDIIIVPAAYLQYQRQSNANPSGWTEQQYNSAGS